MEARPFRAGHQTVYILYPARSRRVDIVIGVFHDQVAKGHRGQVRLQEHVGVGHRGEHVAVGDQPGQLPLAVVVQQIGDLVERASHVRGVLAASALVKRGLHLGAEVRLEVLLRILVVDQQVREHGDDVPAVLRGEVLRHALVLEEGVDRHREVLLDGGAVARPPAVDGFEQLLDESLVELLHGRDAADDLVEPGHVHGLGRGLPVEIVGVAEHGGCGLRVVGPQDHLVPEPAEPPVGGRHVCDHVIRVRDVPYVAVAGVRGGGLAGPGGPVPAVGDLEPEGVDVPLGDIDVADQVLHGALGHGVGEVRPHEVGCGAAPAVAGGEDLRLAGDPVVLDELLQERDAVVGGLREAGMVAGCPEHHVGRELVGVEHAVDADEQHRAVPDILRADGDVGGRGRALLGVVLVDGHPVASDVPQELDDGLGPLGPVSPVVVAAGELQAQGEGHEAVVPFGCRLREVVVGVVGLEGDVVVDGELVRLEREHFGLLASAPSLGLLVQDDDR